MTPHDIPEKLQAVIGDAIRPGGMALTGKAAVFCGFGPNHYLADIGCGFGATGRYLMKRFGSRICNVDVARRNGLESEKIPFIQGCADCLPIGTESFDGLFCECVLSLLSFPEKALQEFHRVLRPSGYLVLSDLYLQNPQPDGMPLPFHSWSCLAGAIGKDEQIRQVTGCGFEMMMWEDHSSALNAFAAELVWNLGSRDALMTLFCPTGCLNQGLKTTKQARPGYFLLIAQKKGKPACERYGVSNDPDGRERVLLQSDHDAFGSGNPGSGESGSGARHGRSVCGRRPC